MRKSNEMFSEVDIAVFWLLVVMPLWMIVVITLDLDRWWLLILLLPLLW